jgi:hypothetical protein
MIFNHAYFASAQQRINIESYQKLSREQTPDLEVVRASGRAWPQVAPPVPTVAETSLIVQMQD